MSTNAAPKLTEMLSSEEMSWIASLANRRKYRDGELIHERGDRERSIGVVVAGQVELINPRSDGSEVFSGLIHTGQNYGDAAMLHGEERQHRAVAMGETVIDHIGEGAFDQLLEHPAISRAFYKIASFRLSVTLGMLDDLRSLSPEVRLARLIVRMQQSSGGRDRLEFLQEEFAGMLGISTVTLAKALRQLSGRGLVATGYRHLRIVDPEGLVAWLQVQERD